MIPDGDSLGYVIIRDRYSGAYARGKGGKWICAVNVDAEGLNRLLTACGDDGEADRFWEENAEWVTTGDTPVAALQAMREKRGYY